MRRLLAFVRLSRPLFLGGGLAGVALGASVAAWEGHAIDAATYAWAQLLVTSLHLMVHYANDYFDRECDRAVVRTLWSGGSGVLADGELPAHVALRAALVCAALGAGTALRFASTGNAVVALLGLAILVGGWIYSAPPLRLAARGLGELDAALVVAVLVPATGYAAFAGAPDRRFLAVLIPCACALFAMMLCVEIPDAAFDAVSGKRNLVVRWGRPFAFVVLTVPTVATLVSLAAVTFGRGLRGAAPLAAVPALAVGATLTWRICRGKRRPATIAFLGVALYGTTAFGLAAAYALALP